MVTWGYGGLVSARHAAFYKSWAAPHLRGRQALGHTILNFKRSPRMFRILKIPLKALRMKKEEKADRCQ